jgi:RNA polymerase sporulation-specific sigma factor
MAAETALPGRNAFVEQNLGLVYALARRFQGRGIEFEDLVQAGCVGLVKATDGFDASRGLAFSTYAVPVILGEIKQLFREGGAVKVGRSMRRQANQLLAQREALAARLGHEPSVGELAREVGLEASEAAMLLSSTMPVLTLTAGDEGGAAQWDVPVEAPDDAIADKIALGQVLETLEERDRDLVDCRYFRAMTQVQTAQRLGMTQVQVSRREKAILKLLRGHLLR